MEAPEPSCPTPAPDQPSPAPGPLGVLGGQASPRLTLGPVLLPPDQGLPPTVILKALPIPLYHTVPPGGLQPRAPLVTGSLDGATLPFILSPGPQPEGPGPGLVGKPAGPALTVSIVGALPMLSPGQGATLGSSGRVRNAGKYLCPHCGRDCLKPSVLEKHIRSHTGERPFPCAACGIAFKTQSNLYKHRRSQTHLNNSRLSLESEGSGGSLLEEGERAGELVMADNRGEEEKTLSPGVHVALATKNLEAKMAASPCPVSALGRPVDSAQTASPQPWRKLPEPKPCSLQRQQDTGPEKPCDSKALEGRLRKCESTDSGYLSRSDSAEQPPVACSPLHSLSEHSAESEGEGAPGAGSGGPRAEQGTPGPSLELEKKRLEERIAQLISHNQAVVEDPQLDHVRPRKTVLSKQGSIDLPMPYTYKDSFHFDIRAQEPSRRRAALGPARSTYTPLDKSRPLFFHSVPTQLSTTVECVPVTRSNSMPFIEGSKLWLEPQDRQDTCPKVQKPLSPKLVPTRPGCRSGLTLADIPSGHPRALVRQAAVEDLLCAPTGDPSAPAEEQEGKKTVVGEGAACKGRAGKKCSQRKSKMFSQEKWQVYGHETFKRIYQKMKTSHGSQKARELRAGQGTELDLPPQRETPGREGTAPSRDHGTPILSDGSGSTKSGSLGSQPAPEQGTEEEPLKQLKAVARAKSSPILGIKDGPCVGSRNLLIPPTGRFDLGCQLPPMPGSIHEGGTEVPQLTLPDLKLEGDIPGRGDTKETCPWTQTVLSVPSRGSADPQSTEDKLPLERKRLKVEGQEQTGPPKSEMPGRLYERTPLGVATLESSGASSAAAPGWLGPADKGSPLPSAARSPGHCSQPSAQPQAARVLDALSDSAFAPKYLLRLPQGESSSAPSTAGPGRGRDALCTGACLEEHGSLSESASGVPGLPGSACAPAPGEAGSTLEEPSWPETRDGKEAHMRREKRDGMNSSTPAAGDPLGSATEAAGDTTSILPTCTHDTHLAQSLAGETQAIPHHLRTVSASAGTSTSGGRLSPWTPIQELGASLKNTPEGFPVQHETRLTSHSPFQARCFLASLTNPPDVPQGRPQSALTPHLETSRSCRAQSSFPSLKAEPQLTWCCLSRSLALPVERERAASGHAALQVAGGSLQGESHCAPSGSSGGRTGTGLGGRGPAQTSKVSLTMASGTRPQDPLWDPKWKKGLRLRKAKTSCGNSRQKKLRLHPKRYEGGFWQSRAQSRASRLRKTAWAPRRGCRPPPIDGTLGKEALGKTSSEVAALNLQGGLSCTSGELPLGHGNEGRKEDGYRRISGATSPSSSTRTVETDNSAPQDLCPSADERGDCSREKEAEGSRFTLQSSTCLEAATEDLLPQGQDLDIGPLGTQPLSSQDQVSTDPALRVFPDAPEPSCFGSKGTFPHRDIATSAEAVCVSSGVRAECETLEVHGVESRGGETLEQSSPDGRIRAEITPRAHLPGKPSSGQRISGLARLGPPGKNHLEVSASGPSSTSSQHPERRPRADFPSGAQGGCGDLVISCTTLGSDGGKCPASGSITLMSHTPSPDPEQPLEVPGAPSRSLRKRSLEGMRKQTRVELSDSSSDDEDRLVIEM